MRKTQKFKFIGDYQFVWNQSQGDCDSDADCEAGLTCVQNVGAECGWPASRDVCR